MPKYVKPLEDDEVEDNRKYRLPYALCKQRGIHVPEGTTPREAWMLLKGHNVNPDVEYKKMYQKLKRVEKKKRKEQSLGPKHSPDYEYEHSQGKIAGVEKGEPMSFEKADGGAPNPHYEQSTSVFPFSALNNNHLYGYNTNCQTCVVAFEARQRGYDVRALPNNRNPYIKDISRHTHWAYIDENGKHPKYIMVPYKRGADKKQFIEDTVKEGERYTIEWAWKGERSGHIISVQRINGELVFYDPQTSISRNYQEFEKWAIDRAKAGSIDMLRVDNCEFNPEYVDYMLKGAGENDK